MSILHSVKDYNFNDKDVMRLNRRPQQLSLWHISTGIGDNNVEIQQAISTPQIFCGIDQPPKLQVWGDWMCVIHTIKSTAGPSIWWLPCNNIICDAPIAHHKKHSINTMRCWQSLSDNAKNGTAGCIPGTTKNPMPPVRPVGQCARSPLFFNSLFWFFSVPSSYSFILVVMYVFLSFSVVSKIVFYWLFFFLIYFFTFSDVAITIFAVCKFCSLFLFHRIAFSFTSKLVPSDWTQPS